MKVFFLSSLRSFIFHPCWKMGNMFHTHAHWWDIFSHSQQAQSWHLVPGFCVLVGPAPLSLVIGKMGWKKRGEGSEQRQQQRTESRFCLKSRFSCEKLEAMRESLLANKNNPCIDPKWWKGRLVENYWSYPTFYI